MPSERLPRPVSRRSWPQRLVLAAGALLSVALLVAAAGLGWGYWQFRNIRRANVSLTDSVVGGPSNYLIVGSDSRAGGDPIDPRAKAGPPSGQRSDTIMVLRIDPSQRSAVMLSLPRDLWVPIAGTGGAQRINTAYGIGKQVLIDTIRQDFGIPINHYVEVDFTGFQSVVEAVGGVPLWFDRAIRDSNSGLDIEHPGCVTLDGYQALAFARARHVQYYRRGSWESDGTGDLGRISRQQFFIRRTIQRAVAKGLGDPLTLERLVAAGTRSVTIDRGLSAQMLIALGNRFRSFDGNSLKSLTVPATPFTTAGGAAVLKLDEAGAQPLFNIFRGRAFDDVSPASVTVTVLNSSGSGGQAANVAGALLQAGFKVDRWGNGSEGGHATSARTLIRYATGNQPAASLLARHLAVDADLAEAPALGAGQLELFVGQDFTTVLANPKPLAPPTTMTGSSVSSAAGSGSATSTTAPPSATTTTTAPIGFVPGDPPPGQSCG